MLYFYMAKFTNTENEKAMLWIHIYNQIFFLFKNVRHTYGVLPTREGNQPKKPRSIIRIWYMMMGHKDMSDRNTSVKNNQVLTKLDHVTNIIRQCQNRRSAPDDTSISICCI